MTLHDTTDQGSETDDGAGSRHGGSGDGKGYSAATEPSEESGDAGAQQPQVGQASSSARIDACRASHHFEHQTGAAVQHVSSACHICLPFRLALGSAAQGAVMLS